MRGAPTRHTAHQGSRSPGQHPGSQSTHGGRHGDTISNGCNSQGPTGPVRFRHRCNADMMPLQRHQVEAALPKGRKGLVEGVRREATPVGRRPLVHTKQQCEQP